MRQRITAFLLSALVFPGLGQLYNQDRKKGIFLVLGANLLLVVLLLGGLALWCQEYYNVFYPRPLTLEILRALAGDTFSHPLFYFPLALLVGLWAYAAVDAGHRRGKPREE
jgi:hypothetical protein